jgi:hypothetical protein
MKAFALVLAAGVCLPQEAPLPMPWGRIEWKADSALLYVEAWPADGKVSMPRLNNPIGTVYLVNDPAKTPLGFQPNVANWTISKPKSSSGGPDVVLVEVKGKPRPVGDPVVAEAADDGSLLLPAHLAVPHGKLLRYEPQPHKNTVGYWADEADWCEWRFRVSKPGRFSILLLQGCGKGQGGSAVKVAVAGQSLDYTVEDSGGFQNFVEKTVGNVVFEKAADFALEIRAVKKAKGAVMDVRQVRLVPVP